MKTLTTPITMQNLTKWKVLRFLNRQDDDVPSAEVEIQVQGASGVIYGTFTLRAFDAQASTVLDANPTPATFGDKLLTGVRQIDGAYTALIAAEAGATGNRAAHLTAIESACFAIGLVGSSLAWI